jgi:hypothetical protein
MWVYHTPKLVSKNPCPEKDVDTLTKKQSSACIVVKVMGKREKSDLNRSRETVSLEGE